MKKRHCMLSQVHFLSLQRHNTKVVLSTYSEVNLFYKPVQFMMSKDMIPSQIWLYKTNIDFIHSLKHTLLDKHDMQLLFQSHLSTKFPVPSFYARKQKLLHILNLTKELVAFKTLSDLQIRNGKDHPKIGHRIKLSTSTCIKKSKLHMHYHIPFILTNSQCCGKDFEVLYNSVDVMALSNLSIPTFLWKNLWRKA